MNSQEGCMFVKCIDDPEMEEWANMINDRIKCQEDLEKQIYSLAEISKMINLYPVTVHMNFSTQD